MVAVVRRCLVNKPVVKYRDVRRETTCKVN